MTERAKRFTNLGGAKVMGPNRSPGELLHSDANHSEDEVRFSDRKRFACFGETDAQLLAEMKPTFEAIAPNGKGVFDTLKSVAKQILVELRKR